MWTAPELAGRLQVERDHELRAALICLLTAAFAAAGEAAVVDDEVTGCFFLRPRDLWSAWARQALSA